MRNLPADRQPHPCWCELIKGDHDVRDHPPEPRRASDDLASDWYCDKCGGAVEESAVVCPHCGDRFDDEAAGDPDMHARAFPDRGEGRSGVSVSANAEDAPDSESWTEFGTWRVESAADGSDLRRGNEITLGLGSTNLVVANLSGTALDRFPYDEVGVRESPSGNAELRIGLDAYATLRPVGTHRTDALISQLDVIRPRLAPDRPVSIWCPTCGAGATSRADASRVDCVGCGGSILLRFCPKCSVVVSVPGEMENSKVQCLSCDKTSDWWRWDRAATLDDVASRGLDAGPNGDPDRRHLTGSVVASTGFPRMALGTWCEIDFEEDSIVVLVDGPEQDDTPVATISYSEVRSLSVGGRGAVTTTTGGGWIGGGFGVEGAVEGAVMAQMLNKLTTRSKTTVETLVHLNAGSQDVVLLNEQVTPMVLETRLAPVFRRLEDAHRTSGGRASEATASIDPLAQLERLAALRDRGVVTPEEFAATKAELLRRLVGG